jgi:uncharacterized glyoxalase superfamily protein PhnB
MPTANALVLCAVMEECRLQTARGIERKSSMMIEGISAVTLATHEMPRAVQFYCALGFEILHGGEESSFTSLRAGASYLNLIAQPAERRWSWWGRVIFYVADVDALYDRALAAGCQPAAAPRDAEWGLDSIKTEKAQAVRSYDTNWQI